MNREIIVNVTDETVQLWFSNHKSITFKEFSICGFVASTQGEGTHILFSSSIENEVMHSFDYNQLEASFKANYTTINEAIDYFNGLCSKTSSGAIQQYDDLLSFPATGESSTLYIDQSTGTIYEWDGSYNSVGGGGSGSVQTFPNAASFPVTGSEGVFYIALDTDLPYLWTGAIYQVIGATVDEVQSYASSAAFPGVGSVGVWYIAEDTDLVYIWDGALYKQIGVDIDEVQSYSELSAFPVTGELATIYIAEDTDNVYIWDGSSYSQINGGSGASQIDNTVTNADIGSSAEGDFNFGFNPATGELFYEDDSGDWRAVGITDSDTLSGLGINGDEYRISDLWKQRYIFDEEDRGTGGGWTIDEDSPAVQKVVMNTNPTITLGTFAAGKSASGRIVLVQGNGGSPANSRSLTVTGWHHAKDQDAIDISPDTGDDVETVYHWEYMFGKGYIYKQSVSQSPF